MKKSYLLIIFIYCFNNVSAQNNLKIPVRNMEKHIAVVVWDASLDIEGYDGDELIIERTTFETKNEFSDKVAGLKNIPLNDGLKEDSIITYKIREDNKILFQINITSRFKNLHIKVPNNLKLFSITSNSLFPDTKIMLKNLKGNFEIAGLKCLIQVSKVTGPFSISNETGKIILSDIFWDLSNKSSLYQVSSLHSDIDFFLPADLKSDLTLFTDHGEVFSDIKLSEGLKLNGGGLKLSITSRNGNIYLRKQK